MKFTFPFPKPTHVNHSFSPIQFISIVSHTSQHSFQSFKPLDTITAMHSLFLSPSSCSSYFSCCHYIFLFFFLRCFKLRRRQSRCALLQHCLRWRHRLLVVVIDVHCFGFALPDESVALVSLD